MSGVQSREAFAELVARIDGELSAGGVPEPPDGLTNEQRQFWKELVNRVRASGAARVLAAANGSPLAAVPVVPSSPTRITRDMLERIVRWKMEELTGQTVLDADAEAALVDFAADWNPSLHPRGPDGKFVPRPWNIDLSPGDINDTSTHGLVEFLGDTPGEPDMDAILSNDGIRIDGIPDDVDSVQELKDRMSAPTKDMDVPVNPNHWEELSEGDVIKTPSGDAAVVDGTFDSSQFGQMIEVTRADGGSVSVDMDNYARNTVDVYEVDNPGDLPSQKVEAPTYENVGVDDLSKGDVVMLDNEVAILQQGAFSQSGMETMISPIGTDSRRNFDFDADEDYTRLNFPRTEWTDDPDVTNVDEDDIVKVNMGWDDEHETVVGRVTDKRFEGAEHTIVTADGDEYDIGAGTGRDLEAYIDHDPVEREQIADLSDIDPVNPDGKWVQPSEVPSEGDVVRFDGPDTSMTVGRAVGDMEGGSLEVRTEDGDVVEVGMGTDHELQGVYRPPADFDTDSLFTEDDIERVDLTELDGDAVTRREQTSPEIFTDREIPAEAVENEQIPEGAFVARESGRSDSVFLYRVEGYEDSVTGKELVLTGDSNRERTVSADRVQGQYHPAKPAQNPDVTIPDADWGTEDDPRSYRKDAVKSVIDDTVPKASEFDFADYDGEIDDDTFEQAKDQIAQHLALTRDKDHVEQVIARMDGIGNDVGRAHATINQAPWRDPRTATEISEGESADTVIHEFGHMVGDAYGFRGGSNDMDGQTYPMPDFKWQSQNFDVPQKYGLKTPPGDDDFDDSMILRNQDSFRLSEFRDEVDAQVGQGLDGRNFSGVDALDDVPRDEGAMIRLQSPPGRGEPQNWEIVEVGDSAEEFGELRTEVTLEARDGTRASGVLQEAFDDPAISWDDDAPYLTSDTITAKRNSAPDNWGENPPDPDDYLGEQSFDDADDAMDHLAENVNKAWYRQAAASREHGANRDVRRKYAIKSGYSAKQAHETWSRIHEVMRPTSDVDNSEQADAAYTLVNYHPDLLEAYRQVYDVPTNMKQALNAVLEQEGADFRFDGVPELDAPGDIETVTDVVREKYNEGEF